MYTNSFRNITKFHLSNKIKIVTILNEKPREVGVLNFRSKPKNETEI